MGKAIPAVLFLSLGLAACAAWGCTDFTHPSLAQRLQADDPNVRIQAVVEAGKAKDPQAVPYLVDRLQDREGDVRFFAILALKQITGQTLDYNYWDPQDRRDQAVQRWREWLKHGRAGGAT